MMSGNHPVDYYRSITSAPAMIIPATLPSQSRSAQLGADEVVDLSGTFVIDAGGKIVAANLSVYKFWGGVPRSFVGVYLRDLFVLIPDASGTEEPESQWKLFKTAMLDRWTLLSARHVDGSCHPVRVRLERSVGGAGTYIAMVRADDSER